MSHPPVIFDITRLATRLGRAAPNGIDRVDIAYAKYFLGEKQTSLGALSGLTLRPRLIAREAAWALAKSVEAGWGEQGGPAQYDQERPDSSLLLGGTATPSPIRRPSSARAVAARLRRAAGQYDGQWLGRSGLWPGADFIQAAPRNAIFLNVSQFPIWVPRYLDALDHRPDIRAVFFVHDLLPVQYPEFFRPFEVRRHQGRLKTILKRAAGLIVASDSTRSAISKHFQLNERVLPPTVVAPLPLSSHFLSPVVAATGTGGHPYFVCVGTIEPRKNHLLLLHVWRELKARMGDATPRLVLVGSRGWENENVVDLLERCEPLKGVVQEASHLSTPDLRRLIAGSRALLMPTFAEGFGLPVAEAVASGIPVIASDIDVFRGMSNVDVELIDPLDGPGWRDAIANRSLPNSRASFSSHPQNGPTEGSLLHFKHVESLIEQFS